MLVSMSEYEQLPLFVVTAYQHWIGGEGDRSFFNILVKIVICPNTFESDCTNAEQNC